LWLKEFLTLRLCVKPVSFCQYHAIAGFNHDYGSDREHLSRRAGPCASEGGVVDCGRSR
jgi:hypothetical protein